MRDFSPNHYERAFENWLIDHHIPYVHSEEHHRPGTSGGSVKNFDFLLRLESGRRIMVEVKGRTFAGTTLAGLSGLECWVTRDDVASLRMWRRALGEDHEAAFVFAYRVVQPDVDFDGQEPLLFGPDRYVFFCIRVEDYGCHMRLRSRKWGTVSLTTEDFRRFAQGLGTFLL
jgi:hypothetical protein